MISFFIDDKLHKSPESWSNIKVSKFLGYLDEVLPKEPQALKDFIKKHYENIAEIDKELSEEKIEKQANELFKSEWDNMPTNRKLDCYKYFSIDVGYWCDCDSKLILRELDKDILFGAYWALQFELNPDNAEIDEEFVGFTIGKVNYFVREKHMTKSTVLEFAESAQFEENMSEVMGGKWKAMLDIMAVLCRPKGEDYSYEESKFELRKQLFRNNLYMDSMINVGFFLQRLNRIFKTNLAIYMLGEELSRKERKILEIDMDGVQ